MTNEQIEQKIKELQAQKRKQLKEQKKKEKEQQLKIKAKEDAQLAAMVRLFYSDKTANEIMELWLGNFEKHRHNDVETMKKIMGQK